MTQNSSLDLFGDTESIVVFTHKSMDFLTKLNGTCSWVLNPNRAKHCKYVVITRNALHDLADEDYLHGMGVFIGKVSSIKPSLNEIDSDRYMIEFDEYAPLEDQEDLWSIICQGNNRMPIRYISTHNLMRELEIKSFESLNWKPVPSRDLEYINAQFEVENDNHYPSGSANKIKKSNNISLVDAISKAKQELSNDLGILEDNIEIIIKG